MRIGTNTVGSLLDLYRSELAALYGVAEARAMARLVFLDSFGWDTGELELNRTTLLSESELLKVYTPLTRLRTGEPLQYVLGHVWFLGMKLHVAPGVLIPRPETEELVHLIRTSGSYARIVDVGTGSGCIALGLQRSFPAAEVTGVDVSEAALRVAQRNAQELGSAVMWQTLDILDESAALPAGLDLVVSNPPYVPRSEADALEPHVRDHEPHLALFVDDADPLLFYRAIARKAWSSLVQGGKLWFEGHYLHAEATGKMLGEQGYRNVGVLHDLSGAPRFIHATR